MKGKRRKSAIVVVMIAIALVLALGALHRPKPHPVKHRPVYPVHTDITATVFWVGEPVGNGSSENNALSAWDDRWLKDYGGLDAPRPVRRYPYFPSRFTPKQNPFYFDLPYNDFDDSGTPRPDRLKVVPWAKELLPQLRRAEAAGRPYSLLKNRWIKLWRVVGDKTYTCYAQWEDSGPYVYDDARYVFGHDDPRPQNTLANDAGMDVSPAVRDCLKFNGVNNATNKVSWRFVESTDVPQGPWRKIVTTAQVNWP